MNGWLVRTAAGQLHFASDQGALDDLILGGQAEPDSVLYQLGDPVSLQEIPDLKRLFDAAQRARLAGGRSQPRVDQPQPYPRAAAKVSHPTADADGAVDGSPPAVAVRLDTGPVDDDLAELDLPAPRPRAPRVAGAGVLIAALAAVGLWFARGRGSSGTPARAMAASDHPNAPAIQARPPAAPPLPPSEKKEPPVEAPRPAQVPAAPVAEPAPTPPEAAPAPALATTRQPATKDEARPETRSYAELIADGSRQMEKGQTRHAKKLFELALASQPNGVEALTGLGYASLDLGAAPRAVKFFRSAIAADARHAAALLGLGEAYRDAGQNSEAIEAFRECVARVSGSPEAGAAKRQMDELARQMRTR